MMWYNLSMKEGNLPQRIVTKYFGIDSEAVPFSDKDQELNTEAISRLGRIQATGTPEQIAAAQDRIAGLQRELREKYQPTTLDGKEITVINFIKNNKENPLL